VAKKGVRRRRRFDDGIRPTRFRNKRVEDNPCPKCKGWGWSWVKKTDKNVSVQYKSLCSKCIGKGNDRTNNKTDEDTTEQT